MRSRIKEMDFTNNEKYDDDYLQYYKKRNSYITQIIEDDKKRKNERLQKYILQQKKVKELENKVIELQDTINKNKENYLKDRDTNNNKLLNLKLLIEEYKY
tara:strand:- start:5028 stop:5330 length:303 start_codon:yes stop_codon:yes gene_type:complete